MDKTSKCNTCDSLSENLFCSFPQILPELDRLKTVTQYRPGGSIFRSGEIPLGLYTIQSGLVKLEAVSESGSAHTLRLVKPGGVLGYRSLFADEVYQASAVAVEKTSVCFIPKAEVMKLVQKFPEVTLRLLSQLAKDLRQAETKWVDQIDKGAPARVAEALLFFSEKFKHENWPRREIAQWAGTTTETVIRTLALFERESLIRQSGREIRILDRHQLAERSLHEPRSHQ